MAEATTSAEPPKRLGEMLLEAKVITEGQLREALELKKTQPGFLGKILMDLRFIDEHTLTNFLVKQLKIPHISLLDYEIPDDVVKMLPREICVRYNLIPIDKMGKILTIAMVDPLDTEAMVKVKEACPELRIKPILCSFQHFEHVLRKAYAEQEKADAKQQQSPKSESELAMESFGLSAKSDKGKRKAPEKAESSPITVSGPALPPSAEEILKLVDEVVRGGVAQAVTHLSDRIRDFVQLGNGTLPVTGLQLAERIRNAISEASETAGGSILQDTKKALDDAQKAASELTALQLGQILQLSMRRALQETSAEVLEEAARILASRGKGR